MMHELLKGYTIEKLREALGKPEENVALRKHGDTFYHECTDLNIDGEEFRDYDSEIKVSNLGRVMRNGEILPQTIGDTFQIPYLYVLIPYGDKTCNTPVHQMVAQTFLLQDNPDADWYYTVHHISGNSLDNRVENLLYVTCEQHAKIHNNSMSICEYSWDKNRYGCQDNCEFCVDAEMLREKRKYLKNLPSDYYR